MSQPRYTDAALHAHVDALDAALARWELRDDPAADQPNARRAASTAVGEIDALLRRLHQVRQELIASARRWDDATNQRVDALLAESRQGRVGRGTVSASGER